MWSLNLIETKSHNRLDCRGSVLAARMSLGYILELENSKSTAPMPLRESQVRPLLNKLTKTRQVPCWEVITQKTEPAKLTGEFIEAEVIEYRKNIPEEELKANKRKRKPKRASVSAGQKAKDKSLKWIERLNPSFL